MKKIRTITYSAMLLAMLLVLQWTGSHIPDPMTKQLVTGSLVNCILAVAVMTAGVYGGVTLALFSPIMAFFLGIAPNFISVGPIMVGNLCYVLLLHWIAGRKRTGWRKLLAVISASVVKFGVMYVLVVQVVCNLAAPQLLGKTIGQTVVLATPMLQMLPAMFSWPQLATALIGGSVAMTLVPRLRKS